MFQFNEVNCCNLDDINYILFKWRNVVVYGRLSVSKVYFM